MRFLNFRPFLAAALLSTAMAPAFAETLSCPSLRDAIQAGACPSEQELRFTFNGFCSADGRAYSGDAELCIDYQNYRKLKNVSLWESADGNFHAYASCDLAAKRLRALKPLAMSVTKSGKMTRLTCDYGAGEASGERVSFTHRTRDACRIDDTAACAKDATACKATCATE